jgi:hypothetical protein
MRVVRQREVNGNRNVFVAYGEETLASGTGGYFSLELVSTKVSNCCNQLRDVTSQPLLHVSSTADIDR